MIEINNLTINQINEEFLKKVAKKVLERETKEKADLSIALVGQGRMRELNKKYRKKNKATDVLAFPGNGLPRNTTPSAFRVKTPKPRTITTREIYGAKALEVDMRVLGEIVICLREVKKNAKRFGSIFEKELARVLIHGILHLLGYDHEKSESEAEKTRKKEEYYLPR